MSCLLTANAKATKTFDEFCEMPADYDMWGEPGFDPEASGGGGYY